MGHIQNRLISAARSCWYGVYEKARLRSERLEHGQPWRWNYGAEPRVSILIPSYARPTLLVDRCLSSIAAQTYKNIEIVIGNHGADRATDSAAWDACRSMWERGEIRDWFILPVPRRRTYPPTAENHWLAGPVDPLNAALKVAKGAWLARIDDDDTWTPDHVEKLLRFAQAGNYEFVSSAYATDERVIGAERGIGGTQTWLWRSYLKFMRWNPDCWRKSWNRVNDMDLAERFRRAGVRIGYLDAVTATVSPRPGETHVGSKAYLADPAKTEANYKFG